MEITLKNIRYIERLSEETHCFSASLYIDGVKAGEASNRGEGGPTDYHTTSEQGKELIAQAEKYCEGLPPHTFTSDGKKHSIPKDLESVIDDLIHYYCREKELQKFNKKVEKFGQKGVLTGIPGQYIEMVELKHPIELILAHPTGRAELHKLLSERIASELQDGKVILNTNIPEKFLKEAGLREDQYVKPVEQQKVIAPKKKPGKKI